MRTEEAEIKLRESEGALAAIRSNDVRKLKEENEELCERLAFLEFEVEECRNALNTERQLILNDRLRGREDKPHFEGRDQDDGDIVNDGDDNVVVESSPPPIEEIGRTNKDGELLSQVETRVETATGHLVEIRENGLRSGPTTDNEASVAVLAANASIQHSDKINESNKLEDSSSGPATDNDSAAVATDRSNQFTDKINELETSIKLLLEENAALQKQLKIAPRTKKAKLRWRWFGMFMDCTRPQCS